MAKYKKVPPTPEEIQAAAARVEAHAESAEAWESAMRETFGPHVDLDRAEWRSHPSGTFRTPVLSAEDWEKVAEAQQAQYRPPATPSRDAPMPGPGPINPEEERLQPLMPNSLVRATERGPTSARTIMPNAIG
jgi:hypothetical protein